MKKPTPAQRRILERLAAGEKIDSTWKRPKFLWGPFIDRQAWGALSRHGWLSAGQITAAGRAALASQASPASISASVAPQGVSEATSETGGGCL